MTRKDFKIIAAAIFDMGLNYGEKQHIAGVLAKHLSRNYPNFQSSKFIEEALKKDSTNEK